MQFFINAVQIGVYNIWSKVVKDFCYMLHFSIIEMV